MAVPFRRTSKTAKRLRRTHFKLSVSGLVTCPNCGATIKSHNVCPKWGYYNGKEVVKQSKKAVEEK
ncbi:MAG: 50S ribosomal protein L32 [Bacilli bacterium]|nr:50S ribosomal protein L32 [Bacilli bacterium]